jgi:hypothetical protein
MASAAFATHVTSNPSRRSPVASGSATDSSSSTSKTRIREIVTERAKSEPAFGDPFTKGNARFAVASPAPSSRRHGVVSIDQEGARHMKAVHAFSIALLLGLAAALGVVAGTRTLTVSHAQAARVQPATVSLATRKGRLDLWEHRLQRALHRKLPKLPKVVHFARVAVPARGPVSHARSWSRNQPPRRHSARSTCAPRRRLPRRMVTSTTTSGPTGGHDD